MPSGKPAHPGKIISIVNYKGGVGKSSVCLNLAYALSKKGVRVLVVDNDIQCNLTFRLLQSVPNKSLYHIYAGTQKVEDCISASPHKNLDIIPNIPDTSEFSIQLIRQFIDKKSRAPFHCLQEQLRPYVLANYDYCFLDNPPNLEVYVACAAIASDYLLIPNDVESVDSHRGVATSLAFLKEIRADNPDLKLLKIILNKVDRRTSLSHSMIDHARNTYGDDLFETIIPLNQDVKKAEVMNLPVMKAKSSCAAARAYVTLADEFLEYFNSDK